MTARPFLKWVGGKTQLLPTIKQNYPDEWLCLKNKTYIEPFVGGGAVLFDMIERYHPQTVIIADINKALINTYITIKNNADELIERLNDIQNRWLTLSLEEKKKYYTEEREQFNDYLSSPITISEDSAARLIFLNKTCFNGLYRVNNKGLFNVPFGIPNATICDSDNIKACSNALKQIPHIEILNQSYEFTYAYRGSNAFTYCDPPYIPLSEHSGSKTYIKNLWGLKETKHLSFYVRDMTAKGGWIMISLADPQHTNKQDTSTIDLFSGFHIKKVSAKRRVSKTVEGRKDVSELLITSY